MDTLQELLEDQLKDIYNAENQLVKALPKLAKKASAAGLKEAFTNHLEQTRHHVERLNEIGKSLDIRLTGKKCAAMEGLIEEGKEVLEEDGEPAILDAALVGAAQRVEHYEIAAYGNARALAEHLGHSDVVTLLQETLNEEGAADKLLTEVTQKEIFPSAEGNNSGGQGAAGIRKEHSTRDELGAQDNEKRGPALASRNRKR